LQDFNLKGEKMRHIAAVLLIVGIPGAAFADGDPVKGEQSFKICMACHAIGPGAKNKVGPELNGIVGRKWGSAEGYSYSQDLSEGKDQGKVWDEAMLNDYIENPKHLAPHGKMPFAGIKNDGQRADVIAYLKQFDAQGNKK
jgi:cytochrome c